MNKFIYLNSNRSGIGDRLLDIILILTYAQYLNFESIYLYYYIDTNDMVGNAGLHTKLRREKTAFREFDYLLKNLQNYIILPDNIFFIENNELHKLASDNNNYIFNEYMGMQYTLDSFMQKKNITDKDKFTELYFQNFQKIKFQNIPDNIRDYFKNNEVITVHLRRGDKVAPDGGTTNNIDTSELNNLNNLTYDKIINLFKEGYKNFNFVSDEKETRNYFINSLKDTINCSYFEGDEITQTYYDLYCLANSKKILLSQRFSAFSIFASMINKTELNYFLDGTKIREFSCYKHIRCIV